MGALVTQGPPVWAKRPNEVDSGVRFVSIRGKIKVKAGCHFKAICRLPITLCEVVLTDLCMELT